MIELEKFLIKHPPSWKYKIEYFHYLIHHLTVLQIQQKDKEYFPVNLKKQKSIIAWNIDLYIKYLVNGEFLYRDNNYIIGEKTYHYKINPDYLIGFRAFEVKPGSKLYLKLVHQQRLKRAHINRFAPHLEKMYRLFMKINLDYDQAKRWIEEQQDETKKYYYYTSLQMIKDKRFRYFKRNTTNQRLDTNLTNLKTELRPSIKGNYISIDLTNSQPFFLFILIKFIKSSILKETNRTKDIPLCGGLLDIDIVQWFGKQQINSLLKIHHIESFYENGELLKFRDSVVNGFFYDDFKSCLADDLLSRDDVKDIIFAILFSRNEVYKDFKRIVPYAKGKNLFAKVYPSIYRMIYLLKKKNHNKLSVILQRIESKVFIDMICPELVCQNIVPLTIHDSVIVKREQADKALLICKKIFNDCFGVIPKFHVTSL